MLLVTMAQDNFIFFWVSIIKFQTSFSLWYTISSPVNGSILAFWSGQSLDSCLHNPVLVSSLSIIHLCSYKSSTPLSGTLPNSLSLSQRGGNSFHLRLTLHPYSKSHRLSSLSPTHTVIPFSVLPAVWATNTLHFLPYWKGIYTTHFRALMEWFNLYSSCHIFEQKGFTWGNND